jgi:uncharacterized protein (DUF433 family)/DNA-binding transcriptional MerR regulator
MDATATIDCRGVYPIRVAARLAHLAPKTVKRWVEGYNYPYHGDQRRSQPITYLAQAKGERSLDFEQLLTLLLVKAFKDKGLALPTIKKAATKAHDTYGLENPFVSKQFRSDGNHVFVELGAAAGREQELINVLSDQREFHAIVEPSLFRDVVFTGEHASEWWPLNRDHAVLLDPKKQFGAPHVAGTGVRTDVIAQALKTEGSGSAAVHAVADWFGLTIKQVEDAAYFEGPWQAISKAA